MTEKIIDKKQNGLGALIFFILLYLIAIGILILGGFLVENDGAILGTVLLIIGILYSCLGWIPLLGLKVINPQEALVLTLFGKYIGTLKKDGFYWVNPFVVAVNPAAATRLSQSGDVEKQRKSEMVSSALEE